MSYSVQSLLAKHPVEASAPCRIDSGGTWDIKSMALPFESLRPVTLNICLDLRTSVILSPYENGRIKISSRGFSRAGDFDKDELRFGPPFGHFFAALSHFGFHGLYVRIESRSPVKSALGGSSTALVALVKALAEISARLGKKRFSGMEILHLAYHLEDGTAGGNCGIQDQAAAVYGGVNLWEWRYGRRTAPFERRSLLDRRGQKELSKRLVVAYSGKSHISSEINRKWIKDFLSGRTRSGWIKVNEIVRRLAHAIEENNWDRAAALLREEMAMRLEITPEAMIPITKKLADQAERAGCGARFAGAGAGGSLWGMGEAKHTRQLRKMWQDTLRPIRGARVLDCEVDPVGVKIGGCPRMAS